MSKSTKKFEINAVVFRNIFSVLFVLLFVTAIALAVLSTSKLKTTAKNVSTVVAQANTIDQTNTRTVTLWNELQKNKNTVNKANRVVADSKSYIYQDVIVNDLNNFARQAGITITNYDFTAGESSSSAAPVATPQPQEDGAAAPIAPTAEAAPTAAAPAPTLKTTSVNVTIETPVNYNKLLTFIHYVEQNLTKMQISKVSLSRVDQDSAQAVNSDALTIEVYIR